MEKPMSTSQHLLRRLDYCPTWLAVPLGLGAGALVAMMVLLWTPSVLILILFVLMMGGAERGARQRVAVRCDGGGAHA